MNCELNNLANETKETIYFSYLDEKRLVAISEHLHPPQICVRNLRVTSAVLR